MIGLSAGVRSRLLRRPKKRLVQRIVLFTSQDVVLASAEGYGPMTIRIAAHATHAGDYQVDPVALANGPVCLALPEVSLTSDEAIAKPGLWACDPQLGPVDLAGQWVFEASPPLAILGLTLTLITDLAGRTTRYAETARQAGSAIAATSVPWTLPQMPVQEPEPELPPQDPAPEKPSPPDPTPVDPLPPVGDPAPEEPKLKVIYADDGTFQLSIDSTKPLSFTINPPHFCAGTYTIESSDYAGGPVNHVKPAVTGNAAANEIYTANIGFWTHDADAGPLMANRRWQRDGVDIPDATAAIYVTGAADGGKEIRWAETLTDAKGSRSAYSDPLLFPQGTLPVDRLQVAFSGESLNGKVFQSGEAWTNLHRDMLVTTTRAYGPSGATSRRGAAERGPIQRAICTLLRGSTTDNLPGGGPAVNIQSNGECFGLVTRGTGNVLLMRQKIDEAGARSAKIITEIAYPAAGFDVRDATAVAELLNDNGQLYFRLGNSQWFGPFVSDLTGGGMGIYAQSSPSAGNGTWPTTFDARTA